MYEIPRDFIAFDLETTGFSPPCRIIEIGAVKVLQGHIVDEFQTFVNPKCSVPSHITRLTGIDYSMVANAPHIEEALPRFISFIGSFPIAAHNASFDMRFINYESKRLGYKIGNNVIDTLEMARRLYPLLKNHKLDTVARHVGVINELEHRGLYDAMAVAGILLKSISA